MTTVERGPRREAQGGPHLGVPAVVLTALFLASLIIGTAIAHGATFPSPFDPATDIQAYFHDHRDAVHVSAFLQFGAAIPLAIYAAAASARLRNLGIRAPGATIALAGGVLSAAFLALSALISWVLSRPEATAEPALTRAVHDPAFATGGPGHVVTLGLLVAGVAVPALPARLLPRWLACDPAEIAEKSEALSVTPAEK